MLKTPSHLCTLLFVNRVAVSILRCTLFISLPIDKLYPISFIHIFNKRQRPNKLKLIVSRDGLLIKCQCDADMNEQTTDNASNRKLEADTFWSVNFLAWAKGISLWMENVYSCQVTHFTCPAHHRNRFYWTAKRMMPRIKQQ